MDTGSSIVQKSTNLPYCIGDSCFLYCCGASPVVRCFKFEIELSGDIGAAERERTPNGFKTLYRQNTGNDGYGNTHVIKSVHKVEIFADVKEKLGDDKIGPFTDLGYSVAPVTGKAR